MSERIEVAQDALRSIAESLDGITHAFHNAPQYEWKILPAGSYLWSLHEGERTRRDNVLRHLVDIQYERNDTEFGLVAYGCCEDLTAKIKILRQIPNLRRIAVSPFANVARCAEQIGKDYVLSYRPSPVDMVAYGFSSEQVRGVLRRDLAACRGCHVDITLKDVETVQHDPTRIPQWVRIAREEIERL